MNVLRNYHFRKLPTKVTLFFIVVFTSALVLFLENGRAFVHILVTPDGREVRIGNRIRTGTFPTSGRGVPPTCPMTTARPVNASYNATPVTQTANRSRSGKVKVVILTYIRSGSTLTGDLFNHHDQVFYLYEPLWMIDFHFNSKERLTFLNGRPPVILNVSDPNQITYLQTDVMMESLNCRFKQMPLKPLDMRWSKTKSESCKKYALCLNLQNLRVCLPLLEKACFSAQARVAKTVRFTMTQAATLLKNNPEVKVIHLIRDPRGRNWSKGKTVGGKWNASEIQRECSRIFRDLKASQTLKQQYPGSVMTARYEDLAYRPLTFAPVLLAVADLTLTPSLRDYVTSITSARRVVKEAAFDTNRSDSRLTADHWRLEADVEFVSMVDRVCCDLYRYGGYLPMASMGGEEGLRNLSIPSFVEPDQVPGLW